MNREKTDDEKAIQKKELKKQEQITNNTFNDRDHIPNAQNAWKETQPQYGYNKE